MSVPSVISDLTATASGNFPIGSDNVFPELDNFLRAHASFIKQNHDFTSEETGAVATTKDAKLQEYLHAVNDFGVDNTGTTNCTTALKAFYDACISSGKPGYIPEGTYKITTGVLAWDNGFVNTAFPYIETAGYYRVNFNVDSATDTDEPIMSWTNGTASSGGGRYWRGGYHGGFTINDSTGATAPNRHGLLLRGLWKTHFGYIVVNNGTADAVRIEQQLYSTTNPDPYAVTDCLFDGVEANYCKGYAFKNDNWVGFNLCTISFLRAVLCEGGVFYGCGAGNVIRKMSVSSCAGWAIDDGGFTAVTGGRPGRFLVEFAEIDDPENGLRINALQNYTIKGRIIHRMDGWSSDTNPLNTSGGYWPRTAVSLAGGTSPNTTNGYIELIHRIESGGVKANVGVFVNGNSSANIASTIVENSVIDNAGFSFSDSDLYTGVSTSSQFVVLRERKVISDSRFKLCAIAVGNSSTTIPNSGWGTATAITIYGGTEAYDFLGLHSTSTGAFTVPFTGVWKFKQAFSLTAAVGTLVRYGFLRDRSGTQTVIRDRSNYKVNAGAEGFEIETRDYFNAGDLVYAITNQNTAAGIVVTAGLSFASSNRFEMEYVSS